jgi:hypothetical protein
LGETQRFIVKDCENMILYTVVTVLPTVTTSTKIMLFLSFVLTPASRWYRTPEFVSIVTVKRKKRKKKNFLENTGGVTVGNSGF